MNEISGRMSQLCFDGDHTQLPSRVQGTIAFLKQARIEAILSKKLLLSFRNQKKSLLHFLYVVIVLWLIYFLTLASLLCD